MTNELTIQGRINQNINIISGTEGPNADFVINTSGMSFQVVCASQIAYGFSKEDNVIITGKLAEVGGDCYIAAESIALDVQMEFKF